MEKVDADPTKEFFVHVITKDIKLEDCILDLLDNCIDGARRSVKQASKGNGGSRLDGFEATISVSGENFEIRDNCGGMSIELAKTYAFRFGRKHEAPTKEEYGIGIYGIGMKRAMFKLGNRIGVASSTDVESFEMEIDVDTWLAKDAWDFQLQPGQPTGRIGTTMRITELRRGIATEFEDPIFVAQLATVISRDYSFLIQKGFSVTLNNTKVRPYGFRLKDSVEFHPIRYNYDDGQVDVEIIAGLAGLPTSDPLDSTQQPRELDYYGWFVVCNDRVVIAASRGAETVWGDEGFPIWHPQYYGFMGIARFTAEDPQFLPWTTTKRDIDLQDPVYRRAIAKMKEATRPYLIYSGERKEDYDRVKQLEKSAEYKNVLELPKQNQMVLPKISRPEIPMATVQYQIERERVRAAGKALGNSRMPYRQVGKETFEYYYKNEVSE